MSLSDRFGLWLGFHKCSQEDYLQMIDGYADHFKLPLDRAQMHHEALEWATTRRRPFRARGLAVYSGSRRTAAHRAGAGLIAALTLKRQKARWWPGFSQTP